MIAYRQTERFALNHDARQGVCNFENRETGELTDLETGADCKRILKDSDLLQDRDFDVYAESQETYS